MLKGCARRVHQEEWKENQLIPALGLKVFRVREQHNQQQREIVARDDAQSAPQIEAAGTRPGLLKEQGLGVGLEEQEAGMTIRQAMARTPSSAAMVPAGRVSSSCTMCGIREWLLSAPVDRSVCCELFQ